MDTCFTPSRCHIDLAALTRNFRRLGDPAQVMPVIKADAYGHGLLPVAKALDAAGAQRFAVGCVCEGLALRKAGFKQYIIPLLGALTMHEWRQAATNDLVMPLCEFDHVDQAAAACTGSKKLAVAIKCETGMSRLGFGPEDLPELVERLRNTPQLEPVLVMSHLACADMPGEISYTRAQIERFDSICASLREAFPSMERSLANSAATVGLPEARYELCRPGYVIYGGNPFAGTIWESRGKDFEWVMSISSPIVQVRSLKVGQSISYGRIFTAPTNMEVAVVGAGYATGFPRALSNHASLLVDGRRVQQVGRVCMSLLLVDVTPLGGGVKSGDQAWVIGGEALPGQRPVTVQELADDVGTIPYELLCLMGTKNPRIYH